MISVPLNNQISITGFSFFLYLLSLSLANIFCGLQWADFLSLVSVEFHSTYFWSNFFLMTLSQLLLWELNVTCGFQRQSWSLSLILQEFPIVSHCFFLAIFSHQDNVASTTLVLRDKFPLLWLIMSSSCSFFFEYIKLFIKVGYILHIHWMYLCYSWRLYSFS